MNRATANESGLRLDEILERNRHHFADPNTGLGNTANFGYITGMTDSPRNIQVGLRPGW